MIRIESKTLEEAYKDAAQKLNCSVTQLHIELVQAPSKGMFGLFKKSAIIIAAKLPQEEQAPPPAQKAPIKESFAKADPDLAVKPQVKSSVGKTQKQSIVNDTILPQSFVSTQDEEDEQQNDYEPVYADDEYEDEEEQIGEAIEEVAQKVQKEINELFELTCFSIDPVEVSAYDATTLLIEFKGEDAALLIGKEGYRYKALSYMLFNWINTQYNVGLRLEIAEFLKNQEEAVSRYVATVVESVNRDGRAQTKILDGVLVQIALKELREIYPDKYVAIRSTRDGLKYIIINDYHSH